MLAFLQNHHVFGVLIALVTAVLVYAYQYTVDPSRDANKKTFYKTLVAGVISSLVLSWAIYRPDHISTEPFNSEPVSMPITSSPAA
jgi:hypothetical protein